MWTRLDDGLFENRKLRRLGRDAFLLYLASVVYASRHLTDGRLRQHDLDTIAHWSWTPHDQIPALIAKLQEPDPDTGQPCWEPQEDGSWRIHDYLTYNPSRAQLLEKRQRISDARRHAGHAGADARWSDRPGHDPADPADPADDGKPIANTMANEWQPDGPVPRTPFVPVPRSPSPDPDPRSFVPPPLTANDANEIGQVLNILSIDGDQLTIATLLHAITAQRATDPIAVALEYAEFRARHEPERRRQPLQGWLLAMSSATDKRYYQRPPNPPAPSAPPTITPTGIPAWDAIQQAIADHHPESFEAYIQPLTVHHTHGTITLTVPDGQNPDYYRGRLAHPLQHACQILAIDPPPIEFEEQEPQ